MEASGSTVSPRPIEKLSGSEIENECSAIARCEYTTPFGFPVVPDV